MVAGKGFEPSTFEDDDHEGVAGSLNELGRVAVAQGDPRTARRLLEESLALCRELGDRTGIAASIEGLAAVAAALGEPDRAACLSGAIERLREEIGAPRPPSERPQHDHTIAAARAALRDGAAFDVAWRKGRAMALGEAVAFALSPEDS